MNKVILMGRLTRDPELRYTGTNLPVASFTLAVDRRFKSEQQSADFIDVVAWRTTAEFVSKWFSKGKMMIVVGSLQIRSWQDKDGNNRRTAEVVAEEVYFGEAKRSDGDGGGGGRFAQSSKGGSPYGGGSQLGDDMYGGGLPASDFEEISGDDDELPF